MFAPGTFTADPAGPILVGDSVNFTCDTGINGVLPIIEVNSNPVTLPPNTPNNIGVYESDPATRQSNGNVFTCKSQADNSPIGSPITLVVHCKFRINCCFRLDIIADEPVISGVPSMITVNEGDSVVINVTIDANPQVLSTDVRIMPSLPSTPMYRLINANTVSVTIPNATVGVGGSYTITVNNSIGMDTENFQLTVLCKLK